MEALLPRKIFAKQVVHRDYRDALQRATSPARGGQRTGGRRRPPERGGQSTDRSRSAGSSPSHAPCAATANTTANPAGSTASGRGETIHGGDRRAGAIPDRRTRNLRNSH